jgi:hypothetical protein
MLVLFAVLVLGGCARSLTESQCVAGDWETVGYRDGSRGLAASHLLEHQNACVRHGIVPERSDYLYGWEQGIARFCTPENGFARGEGGTAYPQVCPYDLEPAFHGAYREGRTLYHARAELRRLEQLQAARAAELTQIDDTLVALALQIATDPDATAADRIGWVQDSVKLARSRVHIEVEIERLAAEVATQRAHLDGLQQALAFRF